jgi:hypothetical protein
MSEFGGGADVQQIRVIALVMITVLLGSANSGHSRDSCELLKSNLPFLSCSRSSLTGQ